MTVTILSALAEPTRLSIVELLRHGPASVNEIADRLSLGQPQTSKHLRVLSKAEIVRVYPMANRRIYHLRREPFKQLEDWLAKFRKQQEERYRKLDAYLARDE